MEIFSKAKVVRLRSHHDRYLFAEDEEAVIQDKNGASSQAKWSVEIVKGGNNVVRLKSCYGRYLTASNKPYLLGLTGHKVIQDLPARLDSSVEWEPVRDGVQIKLKTRYGHYLRANGGTYPYKNSVTHDIPHRTTTQDWILWDVDVLEVLPKTKDEHVHGFDGANSSAWISPQISPPHPARDPSRLTHKMNEDMKTSLSSSSPETNSSSSKLIPSASLESSSSLPPTPPKPNGRIIYYHFLDDDENADESQKGFSILFEGSSVQELTHRLEEETNIEDVIVCTRNVLNEQLYPLHLHLPPNNADMHVVVVPPSSKLAEGFRNSGLI